MQFASLTRNVLIDLKCKGYNVLTSYHGVDIRNPTWQPMCVGNVDQFLLELKSNSKILPLKEPEVLIIEEALMHISDDELGGEVFVVEDHRVKLQQKCKLYDLRYHFSKNPEIYDFSFDPQRILIRNHAIRTGDDTIYREFLHLYYPDSVFHEMNDLEELTHSLLCFDATQAYKWFMAHHVTVMESDIWICDEDAILRVFAIREHERSWNLKDDTDDLMHNLMLPQELVLLRDVFWIDPRM